MTVIAGKDMKAIVVTMMILHDGIMHLIIEALKRMAGVCTDGKAHEGNFLFSMSRDETTIMVFLT